MYEQINFNLQLNPYINLSSKLFIYLDIKFYIIKLAKETVIEDLCNFLAKDFCFSQDTRTQSIKEKIEKLDSIKLKACVLRKHH